MRRFCLYHFRQPIKASLSFWRSHEQAGRFSLDLKQSWRNGQRERASRLKQVRERERGIITRFWPQALAKCREAAPRPCEFYLAANVRLCRNYGSCSQISVLPQSARGGAPGPPRPASAQPPGGAPGLQQSPPAIGKRRRHPPPPPQHAAPRPPPPHPGPAWADPSQTSVSTSSSCYESQPQTSRSAVHAQMVHSGATGRCSCHRLGLGVGPQTSQTSQPFCAATSPDLLLKRITLSLSMWLAYFGLCLCLSRCPASAGWS